MSSEELRLFDKVRVYLDEDYSSAENFTVSMNYYIVSIKPSFVCACVWGHARMGVVEWSASLPSVEALVLSILLLLRVRLKMTARKMTRK